MSAWKLIVDDYGKIGHAEIETAPLTLFVGDNNSGKSYLLSLLWGIRSIGVRNLLGEEDGPKTEESVFLINWMRRQIETALKEGSLEIPINDVSEELSVVLNDRLEKYKNKLARWIFNSNKVKIGQLRIELKNLRETGLFLEVRDLHNSKDTVRKILMMEKRSREGIPERTVGFVLSSVEDIDDDACWKCVLLIYSLLLGMEMIGDHYNENVFLPAARTGFMLTKDVINRVERENTFNLYQEKEEITPFTRPINQFLTVMGELSPEEESEKRYRDIEAMIEKEMTDGAMEIGSMPGREIQYIPFGEKEGMPLRIVSAVVTELSPLMLILQHKKYIRCLFYEEPEMCLHPQLQQKMGKVLVQIANTGAGIVTTHSDIILQHVNNMIKLNAHSGREEICEKMGYGSKDLLSPDQVKVYQLTTGKKTKVRELACGRNGFEVPTFNDALDKIMDEAYEIQE